MPKEGNPRITKSSCELEGISGNGEFTHLELDLKLNSIPVGADVDASFRITCSLKTKNGHEGTKYNFPI